MLSLIYRSYLAQLRSQCSSP